MHLYLHRQLKILAETKLLELNITSQIRNLLAEQESILVSIIEHIPEQIGKFQEGGFQEFRLLSCQRNHIGHHIKQKMRTDLGAQKPQLRYQLFGLSFLFQFLRPRPVRNIPEDKTGQQKGNWREKQNPVIEWRENKFRENPFNHAKFYIIRKGEDDSDG